MRGAVAPRSPIVADASASQSTRTPSDRSAFERHAAIGLWAGSLVLILGTAVDLAILWVVQRQAVPTWEFVAIANTLEAYPRIALGLGLAFPAIHLQHWGSRGAYRVLASLLILMGVAAAALGVLEMTDYFVLRAEASPQTLPFLRSTALKAATLGGMFFVVLTTLGVLGWRRPKS